MHGYTCNAGRTAGAASRVVYWYRGKWSQSKKHIESRKTHFTGAQELKDKIHFDSPLFFDIDEVLAFAKNKNEEMVQGAKGLKQGPLFGQLSNFVNRLENKLGDKRMEFLLGNDSKDTTLEDTLKQLLGYFETGSNVTVLDLSGIPFDVLSITVSLISRIVWVWILLQKVAWTRWWDQ